MYISYLVSKFTVKVGDITADKVITSRQARFTGWGPARNYSGSYDLGVCLSTINTGQTNTTANVRILLYIKLEYIVILLYCKWET